MLDPAAHGAGHVGVFQDDVGTLAAQFLRHALDGRGGGLGHFDAGAGRTGERHHVDARMAGHGGADFGASAVDQVEHAGRNAGGVHDFRPDDSRERRFFGRLEHHGAAGGQGRDHFTGDLVDRPIPRGDQAAHADRFLDDAGRAAIFFELEGFEHRDARGDMADADRRLRALRQAGGSAHFLGDGVGDVAETLLIFGLDAFQQIDALFTAGLRIGDEGFLGGLHRLVDVGGGAGGDMAAHRFGGGIDHVQALGGRRIDPGAVYIEFHVLAHAGLLDVVAVGGGPTMSERSSLREGGAGVDACEAAPSRLNAHHCSPPRYRAFGAPPHGRHRRHPRFRRRPGADQQDRVWPLRLIPRAPIRRRRRAGRW